MKKRDGIILEGKQLITAPIFYCYCLALILVFLLLYLPGVQEAYQEYQKLIQTPPGSLLSFDGQTGVIFVEQFGLYLSCFPAFVVATAVVRDRKRRKTGQPDYRSPKGTSSLKTVDAVVIRTLVQFVLLSLPVLLLAGVAEGAVYGEAFQGKQIVCSSLFWLLPSLLLVISFTGLITELSGSCLPGILAQLVVWVFIIGTTRAPEDSTSGTTLREALWGGTQAGMKDSSLLVTSRLAVILAAVLLVGLTVLIRTRKNQTKQEKK